MKEPDSHETYKVAASRLHWIALALVGSLLAIVVSMYCLARPLMTSLVDESAPSAPPTPRLQPDPARDLAANHRRERAKLDEYTWLDPQHGVARIPIERAMQLLAQSPPSADTRQVQPQPRTPSTQQRTSAEPPR